MSLLAASAAAYNKELSLISHFILHLRFDQGYTEQEGLFVGLRHILFFFKPPDENLGFPSGWWVYLKYFPSFIAKLQGHGLVMDWSYFLLPATESNFFYSRFTVYFKLQPTTLHFGSSTWQQDIIRTFVITSVSRHHEVTSINCKR